MIRKATMADVPAVLELVNMNAKQGLMLSKSPYDIYQRIFTFFVYEKGGQVVGCVRLQPLWKDIAEIASLAVAEDFRNQGIGRELVQVCMTEAKRAKIPRICTLTYQCEFFKKCGFKEVPRETLPHKFFGDCLRCPKVECCDEYAFIIDL
ncbi:MAG: N-acetyltransferase [Alphaproteobacteria bacterium]|nr:N-acetyltransferase [Alphaproteobacteria bacterium]